ncbi:hypothetical protein FA13DRAFT_815290 [Coprinellus micaceus]|uniref:Uncharacterized protein n=1 Tax=Coprinellus micaceus TaxID=71717 RepID=A0A4Y7T2G1_COPMI|nr:hypothetical protein FA13DRAFT_815290 [Coprinellus micaceus]
MAAKTQRYGVHRRVAEDDRGATGPFILGGASHATIGTINIHSPNRDVLAHPQPSPQPLNPTVAVSVSVQCEHSNGEMNSKETRGNENKGEEIPRILALLGRLRFSFPSLPFFVPTEQLQGSPATADLSSSGNEGRTTGGDVQVIPLDKQEDPAPSDPACHEVYVQAMLGAKYGLPCWSPGSTDPKIHPFGVVPGDVGTYTTLDGFQISFNLFADQATLCRMSKMCRTNGRCRGLKGRYSTKPNWARSGDTITRGASVQAHVAVDNEAISSVKVLHEFCCTGQSGAILAMPTPVDMEKADSPVEIGKYIRTHADAIFRHANAIQPLGDDESIYIATSCVKSGSWAMAAYKDKMAIEHNTLQLVSIDPGLNSEGSRVSQYSWTQRGLAQTQWGRSDEGHMKDQALFLRGFKLAVSEEFRLRMENGDDDDDDDDDGESNSKGPRDAQLDRNHASGDPDFGGKEGPSTSEGSQGNDQGSGQNSHSHYRAHTPAESGIDCASFPGSTNAPYHPSDVINAHVLLQVRSWCVQ